MSERDNVENIARANAAFSTSVTVRQMTENVIMALTRWNAAALDLLAREASGWVEKPPPAHQLAAAADQYRLLGALLQETERNLRLFRETSPCAELQSKTGTYESRWS